MKMRLFIPLRFKILFTLLVGITVVVSFITLTMANLFHADKTAYIRDYISTNAIHTAMETRSLIQNYIERGRTFARVAYDDNMSQVEKSRMLDDLFQDFSEVVAITFLENGEELASVFDERTLEEAGLLRSDFDNVLTADSDLFTAINSGAVLIKNSTISSKLPAMTLLTGVHVPGREADLVIEILLRTDNLIAIVGRSQRFEAFILESNGSYLVHNDPERIKIDGQPGWVPDKEALPEQSSLAATFDYVVDGIDMIGGFARVEIGQLMVGVQIPRTAAFLSARELFNNLLGVSLVILLGAAAISLIWSYRITLPLERLSKATKDVGRGEFEIHLKPTSHDEIGSLTSSVNQMAYELREREKALQEAQAALIQSEKMSAFGQLSAGIAHEVKNPLAGILGYVQLSLKKLKDNPPLQKNLAIIEKETRRCNSIIENLMKFARQDKPRLEPLEINDVVEDAITLVDHQMGLSEIHLGKNLSDELPVIRGDANQLIQVFMNILINAQQAMDGTPGTVSISTSSSNEKSVEVRIEDSGPGMPEEVRSKIFEPFFTTKAAGKGTGLGLAVTYGIIKDHSGDIRVESEPGKGTTFIITLPVANQTPDEMQKEPSAESTGEPLSKGGN